MVNRGNGTGSRWEERRSCDKSIVVLMVMLLVFGLITLFSATYYQRTAGGDALSAVKKQLLGVGLGAAACVCLSQVPYRVYRKPAVTLSLLAVAAVLLVLVIIPGIGVSINGSRRWLNLFGLSMQPSEFAKYAMVIFMAGALDRRADAVGSLFGGVVPLLIVPGIMFLLILEQPNLSTGGSILICALVMLIAAGLKKRHMALLTVCGLCVGGFYAWSAPYRRARLLSFRDPFAKMSNEGYQLSQSLIALGSGGLFGMGLGQGKQKFAYLPYPESDFIFAIVGEDFGFFWLSGGDRAFCGVCACRAARGAGVPQPLRMPSCGGDHIHDRAAGVYQYGRRDGNHAHDGAAASLFQCRRNIGYHDHGGSGYSAEYIQRKRTIDPRWRRI